jgi:uncharacterized membrane protein YfhO
VIPETDDGGWSADLEGRPVPTLRVDEAFLGIRVPAGETAIVCRYTPPGLRAGAWISVASAAMLGILAIRIRIRTRRRP